MDQRQPKNWTGTKFTPCSHVYQCADLDPTIDGILACSVYKTMIGYSLYGQKEVSFPLSHMEFISRAGETQTRGVIKELIQTGHIEKEHTGGKNGRDYNRYSICLPEFYRDWMEAPKPKLTDKQRIDRAIKYITSLKTVGHKETDEAIKLLVSIKKGLSQENVNPKKAAASELVQDKLDIIIHDNPDQTSDNDEDQDSDLFSIFS